MPSAGSSIGPSVLDEDIHAEAKAPASRPLDRPDAAHSLPAKGILTDSVGQVRENYVCRPSSGAGGAETPNGESAIDTDAEARRIAGESVKLHKAGAIKSEQDASFYANLVRLFGASFTASVGPYAHKPGAPNGFTVPEPGKPYTPTAAQRVEIPRGLSRKQEAEFLARDLEEALAYEPTPEETRRERDRSDWRRAPLHRTLADDPYVAPRRPEEAVQDATF